MLQRAGLGWGLVSYSLCSARPALPWLAGQTPGPAAVPGSTVICHSARTFCTNSDRWTDGQTGRRQRLGRSTPRHTAPHRDRPVSRTAGVVRVEEVCPSPGAHPGWRVLESSGEPWRSGECHGEPVVSAPGALPAHHQWRRCVRAHDVTVAACVGGPRRGSSGAAERPSDDDSSGVDC